MLSRRLARSLPLAVLALSLGCGESDPTDPAPVGDGPIIISVTFPDTASTAAGSEDVGTVVYSDADGDAVRAIFEEISDPNDAIDGDFELSITQSNPGQDSFDFVFECPPGGGPCIAGTVTLGVTVRDSVGRESVRAEFTFTFAP